MQINEEVVAFVRQVMTEYIPFNKVLGIQVDELGPAFARLSIPFRPELVGDPMRPALHGGVTSALVDTCGGAAVWTTVSLHDRVSTIDLRVDFLRPARLEPLIAEAHVIRSGNRVGVTSIRVFQPSHPTEVVAEGRAVYNIKRGSAP